MFTVCSACLNCRNVSYKGTSEGSQKRTHNIQQMPCRWGNGHNRAPVLLHSLLQSWQTHTHTLIIVPVPADTHRHTDGHTHPLSSPGNAQISATYSLLFTKHSQKEWHHPSKMRRHYGCERIQWPLDGAVVNRLWDASVTENEEPFDLCILFSNLSGR